MQDRLEPLIAERAPWLFSDRPGTRFARGVLDTLLGSRATIRLAETLEPLSAHAVMDAAAVRIARRVRVTGLAHVPVTGPALIVANHPTGIADGIVLWHAVAAHRADMFFYANSDILRVLPQLDAVVTPVEWRREKRSHAKARVTMAHTRVALAKQGRLGVIFPSGRLAKRHGLRLFERPWMASAALIARRFDVPVIPVHIGARNSGLFYLFDALHPTLRDITLFHETLNKARQPFMVTIGAPIAPQSLPERAEDAIEILRAATLQLGEGQGPFARKGLPLLHTDRPGPGWGAACP